MACRIFHCAGWLALGLSLMADAPSMAALVWMMSLAPAAVAVGMLLNWRPQWLGLWTWGCADRRLRRMRQHPV